MHSAVRAEAIEVKSIAEIETRVSRHGVDAVKLLPARHVVHGDQVVYTLEIRNTLPAAIAAPTISFPIPDHTSYIANSAVGPGAEVSYSVDGGRSFDHPENLKVAGPKGALRVATPADYTHIRWQLKHSLKGNAIAYARFRALVK
jgi:uncharacterized repeat protein (TIGR01451 family)